MGKPTKVEVDIDEDGVESLKGTSDRDTTEPRDKVRKDLPGSKGSEVLRDQNGTGDEADEDQLGVTKEEVKDLANDAEGG
jgi:hypothetical protein